MNLLTSTTTATILLRINDDHGIVAMLTVCGWLDVAGEPFTAADVYAIDAFAQGRTRSLVLRGASWVCSNPRLIAVSA